MHLYVYVEICVFHMFLFFCLFIFFLFSVPIFSFIQQKRPWRIEPAISKGEEASGRMRRLIRITEIARLWSIGFGRCGRFWSVAVGLLVVLGRFWSVVGLD